MNDTRRVPFQALRTWATSLAIVGLMFPFAPQAAAQAASSATVSSRATLTTLSGLLDRATFDVGELSLELDGQEPEEIAAWVADRIAYQAYAGLLRGPQGTLIAKAGNALDQAVLLAKLLRDAGYEARVALGSLTQDDASALNASMFVPRAPAGPSFDLADLEAAFGSEAEGLAEALAGAANADLEETAVYREAVVETQRLLQVLDAPQDLDATAELTAEAQEYAWVEYRSDPSSPWTAAHPAFGAVGSVPVVAADEYLEDAVPAELTHRLRIEVSIERKRGDEYEEEPIMEPWERPVANMVGVPLEIGNTVMGDVNANSVEEMRATMAESAFFAPVFNGALAPGAQAFDLNGNVLPPDAAASEMAGVFQTLGEKLGGALDIFGAMGTDEEPEETFALTAQYVDFVLVAPGGSEKRFRRTIFDRRDPNDRAEGGGRLLPEETVLDSILTMQTVMVSVGAIATDYVIAGLIEQAEQQLDVLDRLAVADTSAAEFDQGAALMDASGDLTTRDHLQLFAAFDAFTYDSEPLVYRAEPTVVSLFGTFSLDVDGTSVSGVDIVSNARRAFTSDGGTVTREFPANVFAGVWDTLMEREFLASRTVNVVDSVPSPGALARFDSYEALTEAGAAVPAEATAAVQRDLDAGYAVVIREGAEPGRGWSYWRVDQATGETLGIGSSGRGVTMAEYLANLQVGLIVSGFLSVPSFMQCISSGASWTCYCDVAVSAVALPLGLAYLGALAGAAGLIFTILDIAVLGPVTTLVTPPMCSGIGGVGRDEVIAGVTESEGCWAS